jgi:hypothetical protein
LAREAAQKAAHLVHGIVDLPADLAEVIEAWAGLSELIREAVLRIVREAAQEPGELS